MKRTAVILDKELMNDFTPRINTQRVLLLTTMTPFAHDERSDSQLKRDPCGVSSIVSPKQYTEIGLLCCVSF
jgi:hypothetical protein